MKNFFKVIGIIALVAVIGFTMTACEIEEPVNTSLDGVWTVSGGYWVVTISGSSGNITSTGNVGALWSSAISKGYVRIGSQYYRNLTSTGNLTWSGQDLRVTYNSSSPNVATGTRWGNCTITMSSNGQTFTETGTDSSGTVTVTYTRQ